MYTHKLMNVSSTMLCMRLILFSTLSGRIGNAVAYNVQKVPGSLHTNYSLDK